MDYFSCICFALLL